VQILLLRRSDVRLDLFGGLANWAIFLDHIQQEVLSCITRIGLTA
jgi:hypothetical protein